ncbi:hypothetical protein PHLGIDRAFT_102362 [Phlebiopsis gigantea 11061_1 CR5-6]|uniref:Haloacid dehalogenase n=1 Tax=Phlebiopsis gigantea (strain 11061_1 CR5-6) TaxID=745531 RepID=A0A0C3PRH1_PHLG1|nr:hypothetical protein PHLGIDRAFT_102362 [Phlebiopsis gigantea 11061_1 CR5-6]
MSNLRLTQYKALVFDVYATLVDWETGIFNGLKPMLDRLESPLAESKKDTLLAFESVETDLQRKYPTMLYSDILAHVHAELLRRLTDKSSLPVPDAAEDIAFGNSIPTWPVFPDTIPALAALSKHFKLAVLSNVDQSSFAGTRAILERSDPAHHFAFDAVYTAQDVGSYKPDPANFRYALGKLDAQFGVQPEEVLVVAASLTHDHAPANRLGLKSVYIARQGAVMSQGTPAQYNWKFDTLGDMAAAVAKEAGRA